MSECARMTYVNMFECRFARITTPRNTIYSSTSRLLSLRIYIYHPKYRRIYEETDFQSRELVSTLYDVAMLIGAISIGSGYLQRRCGV